MKEIKYSYKIQVGKREGKTAVGRFRRRFQFTDFNLREGIVTITTDALFKRHAMTVHKNRVSKSAGIPRC
jgi:hypothetical protein